MPAPGMAPNTALMPNGIKPPVPLPDPATPAVKLLVWK